MRRDKVATSAVTWRGTANGTLTFSWYSWAGGGPTIGILGGSKRWNKGGVRHLCDEGVGASDELVWSLIRPLPNNFPKRQSNCYSANIISHPALPRMPHPQTTKGSFLSVRLRRERLTMKHRTLRRSPPHGNRRTPCSRLGTRARNGHSLRLSSVLSYSLCIMIS